MDLDGDVFAHDMACVALSRGKSLEGVNRDSPSQHNGILLAAFVRHTNQLHQDLKHPSADDNRAALLATLLHAWAQ